MKFRVCDLYNALNTKVTSLDDLENIHCESTLKMMKLSNFKGLIKVMLEVAPNNNTSLMLFEAYEILNSISNDPLGHNLLGKESVECTTAMCETLVSVLTSSKPDLLSTYLELCLSQNELLSIISVMEDEVEYSGTPKKTHIPAFDCLKYYMKHVKSKY